MEYNYKKRIIIKKDGKTLKIKKPTINELFNMFYYSRDKFFTADEIRDYLFDRTGKCIQTIKTEVQSLRHIIGKENILSDMYVGYGMYKHMPMDKE